MIVFMIKKQILLLILLQACFHSNTAFAGPFTATTFNEGTTAKVTKTPVGKTNKSTFTLVFEKGKSNPKKLLTSDAPIELLSEAKLNGNTHTVVLESEGKVYALTRLGKLVQIPLDNARWANSNFKTPAKINKTVSYIAGTQNYFTVLDFAYPTNELPPDQKKHPNFIDRPHPQKDQKPTPVGRIPLNERFIVREDGVFTRIDYIYNKDDLNPLPNSNTFPVPDRVLQLEGSIRPISIDQFEAESHFLASPTQPVTVEDGSSVHAAQFIKDHFPSLSEQLISSGKLNQPTLLTAEDARLIETMRITLADPEAGSFAITGEAGSGKSTVLLEFAAEILRGKYPEIPKTTLIIKLTASNLEQGGKWKGVLDSRIEAIKQISKMRPCLLFVDQLESILNSGASLSSPSTFLDAIHEELSNGTVRIIGNITTEDYRQYILPKQSLARRIKAIQKESVGYQRSLQFARSWINIHHPNKGKVSDAVLEHAYQVANRYSVIEGQPARLIQLIAGVFSQRVVLSGVRQQRKAITIDEINQAASRIYGLNPIFFNREELVSKLDSVKATLKTLFPGSDHIINPLIQLAKEHYTGLRDPNVSRLQLGLLGPKGTGKTTIMYAFAKLLNLPPPNQIDMGKYSLRSNLGTEALLDEIAQFANANPFSPIIFDELDSASPDAQNVLRTAFNQGYVMANLSPKNSHEGRRVMKVSIRNTPIVFTSNVGTQFIQDTMSGKSPQIGFIYVGQQNNSLAAATAGLRDAAAKEGFSDTLLDRVPVILPTVSPSKKAFSLGIKRHLDEIISELVTNAQLGSIEITNEEEFLKTVTRAFYKEQGSHRESKAIAQAFVFGSLLEPLSTANPGEKLSITFNKTQFSQYWIQMTGCAVLLD